MHGKPSSLAQRRDLSAHHAVSGANWGVVAGRITALNAYRLHFGLRRCLSLLAYPASVP
ncbi:hypothetical protein KCP73_01085 [Salmonella enterica subsp. enterica]|nr:hypothetical protein KCP73_01085 [Salmonella enterica subsp. enterica]